MPDGYLECSLPTPELAEALDEGGARLTEEVVIDYLREAESDTG